MYDLLAILDAAFVQDLVDAYYDRGLIPSMVAAPGVPDPKFPPSTLRVWLDKPAIEIESEGEGIVLAYRQAVTARAVNIPGETASWMRIRLPVELVAIGEGADVRQGILVDFGAVSALQIELDEINPAIYRGIIQGMVVSALQQIGRLELPVAPPGLPKLAGHLAMNTSPIHVFSELNFAMTLDGRDVGPLNLGPSPQLVQKTDPSGGHWSAGALIASAQFVEQKVLAALTARGFTNGNVIYDIEHKVFWDTGIKGKFAVQTNSDSPFVPKSISLPGWFASELKSITLLSDPQVRLANGALLVSGRVEANVTFSIDPEVDFEVAIGFLRTPAGFKPVVKWAKADFDERLITALSAVVAGPVGLLVAGMLDGLLDREISKQLSQMPIPLEVLPLVMPEDRELTGSAEPEQQIWIRFALDSFEIAQVGVILRPVIKVVYKPAPIFRVPYVRCHTTTLEAHQTGCEFGDWIQNADLKTFLTVEEALADGYDGCRKCLPEANGKGPLRVRVLYRNPTSKDFFASVHVTGKRLSGPASKYLQAVEAKEVPTLDKGQETHLRLKPLANGKWEFKIESGGWSTTVVKKLANKGQWVTLKFERT